jgi:probable addiction module antidote protein
MSFVQGTGFEKEIGQQRLSLIICSQVTTFWPTNRRNGMSIREHKASRYLKTPQDIAAYLNAAIEEMEDDPRLLMKAFRNVAEAQGGVFEIARQARLDRVALSRALSGRRNPRLDTLAKLSAACGIKLRFSV